MYRLVAIAAALLLAGCNYLVSAPTEAQLSKCFMLNAAPSEIPVGKWSLGELIKAAENQKLKVGWRQNGSGQFLLIINRENVDPSHRITAELAEITVPNAPSGCATGVLSIRDVWYGDRILGDASGLEVLVRIVERSANVDEPARPATSAEPTAAPNRDTLTRIFQRDMLGATVSHLEQLTGPARQANSHVLIYQIDGCDVVALTDGRAVTALGMRSMNDRCNFDMRRFLPDMPANPSYENLEAGLDDGAWRATCLIECGNAVDPTTFFQARATRGGTGLEVVAHGVGTPELWYAALAEHYGEAWVEQGNFNCPDTDNMPAVPMLSWGNQRPDTLIIGRGMIQTSCRIPKADVLVME